jgi:beta-glucosidase
MVRAQIVAFQNGTEGVNPDGIVACIKHFPGAGPQMDGKDTSPIVADDETLQIHLKPYYAAIEVNVGSVMPYYSVPLALDMENSAIGSKAALQDLLREQMGFEGIIQTDWGMIWAIQEGLGTMTGEEVSDEKAIIIGVTESRVDGIGGESIRLIDQMEELVGEGKIDEAIVSAAAKRIVKAKFELGVFENPYCDVDYALSFVGNEEHTALNLEAARKAMTLLKNDGTLPLTPNAGQTILVCGPRAGDMDSLVGGWSSSQEGLTIAAAVAEYAGENDTVTYIADDVTAIAEAAKTADVVIVSVGEPSYQHDPPWGYATLDITPSQQEILEAVKANTSGKIITVVTGGRPYILTWCDENTNAILEAYYPGQQGGIAIAETLFGLNNPTGKTPLQFPRDMQSVNDQSGDVSFDLENPLYDYGWGLSYDK